MAHREADLMILCAVLHQMKENRKNLGIIFSWMKRQNQKHQNTVWVRPAAPKSFPSLPSQNQMSMEEVNNATSTQGEFPQIPTGLHIGS